LVKIIIFALNQQDMKELIVIGISEEGDNLIVKTSVEDQVELIGILEMVKMQILTGAPKMKAEDVKFSNPKTEA
jgi:hypothetical protein